MKRNLVCSLALLGLLASAGMAATAVEAQNLDNDVRRPAPGLDMTRSLSCENATVIGCNHPTATYSIPAAGGEWFYYVGNGLGMTIDTRFGTTTADSDLYIYTGTCGNLTQVFYRDGDSPLWQTYLNCSDFVFANGVGYYIYITDWAGAAGDVTVDFTCCEAAPFVCPPTALQHDEQMDFGPCNYDFASDCGYTWCGAISSISDVDTYWFEVTAPNTTITFNVFGDDTPSQAAFGFGLDPVITVYNENCEVVGSDDDGGTGFDSRLLLECMTPGYYFAEVSSPYGPGPYLFRRDCAVCCWETNTATNPDVVITDANFMNYVGEANAYVSTVNLADYCSITAPGPGCFGNGHCILDMDGGEWWFQVYQPATGCYAMRMRTSPAYSPTCNTLVGVARGGTLLGWFAMDASNGLFPSVYNEPAIPNQTTFVLESTASCSNQVTVSVWYEDLCPPVNADDQPVSFALSQNVPNPFNPSTTISFTLPESGVASLKVFDLTGREVATLVDGMTGRGEHSVVFDGSQLSTGVYFYTLQFNGQSETQKMVLVK